MTLHRIHGASCLSALRPGHDYRPALDELAGLGFDLVRVFAGELPWCGQNLQHVYGGLPTLLDEARARSLNVYVSYITEAGRGYNLENHIDEIERIVAGRDNILREVANEYDHETQGGRLNPSRLLDLKARMHGPASCGATIQDDESDNNAIGTFGGPHLDRGRDKWNMVRRIREQEAMSARLGKAIINQEMIGADEVSKPGSRESDPAIFYTAGVLGQIMAVGSLFHSTNGRDAVTFQPNQRRCAEAFLAGYRLWSGPDRLVFKNTGWADSPVKDAQFTDEGGNVVRVYSGVAGNTGITCALGLTGDPRIVWQNGWTPRGVVGEMPGVTVQAIGR